MSRFLLLLGSIIAIMLPARAQEPPQCASVDQIIGLLTKQAGEVPVASARSSNGKIIFWFASPEGNWTMVVIVGDGSIACVAAHGTEYEKAPPLKPPEKGAAGTSRRPETRAGSSPAFTRSPRGLP